MNSPIFRLSDCPQHLTFIDWVKSETDWHDAESRAKPRGKYPTLIELEGNTLFNFDPQNPRHGQGVKTDLPAANQLTWTGNRYKKDEHGNYRDPNTRKGSPSRKNQVSGITVASMSSCSSSFDSRTSLRYSSESVI